MSIDNQVYCNVIVVMPVFDSQKYLKYSIESVLNQTYRDFKFLIINDGSTDESEEIINNYPDPRIIYRKNNANMGITETLNYALSISNSKYIIRMDSDDISHKNRFQIQVDFMEKHLDVAVCGTSAVIINEENSKVGFYNVNTSFSKIKTGLIFNSELIHPSVIIRKSSIDILNLRYNEKFKACEDYGFWVNIIKTQKVNNIAKPLLFYRKSSNSITALASKKISMHDTSHIEIYKQTFYNIDLKFSEGDLMKFRKFTAYNYFELDSEIVYIVDILARIKLKIKEYPDYNIDYFDQIVLKKIRYNSLNSKKRLKNYFAFISAIKKINIQIDIIELTKFIYLYVKLIKLKNN